MSNLFFRTTLAPYRIDFYNYLFKYLNMSFYFYRRIDMSQNINMDILESQCNFTPNYLDGFELGMSSRKLCTGLYKILKSNKPEIVIVPEFQILTLQLFFLKYLFFRKIKIISLCDDSYDMIVNRNNFTLIHEIARKLVTPFLDEIIVVEPRVRDWYQKKYNKGIWFPIIRNEINARREYEFVLPLSNEINERYNLKCKRVVLFVGRLVALKNLYRFLNAVEKLKEDCVVVIIGSGEEEEGLKKHAKAINKEIIFTGRLEGNELSAWYNVSDIFVLLSTQEAFGAVTNEALLAGNYAVVSEKAGSNCLIKQKVNGIVVDPYDELEISISIDKLLVDVGVKSEIIHLKKNLMCINYEDMFNNLIKTIMKNGKN